MPIQKDGQIVGILGTPIELRNFSNHFIKPVTIGQTGYAYSSGKKVNTQKEELENEDEFHSF